MNVYTDTQLDEWVKHYVIAALWSSTYCKDDDPEGNHPIEMDSDFDFDDVAEESLKEHRLEIVDFIESCTKAGIDLQNEEVFPDRGEWSAEAQHAHDLWLTRNHHGVGFCDRGYGEVGDKLTELAQALSDASPYVGDSGRVYLS